jgi:YD repeat-containing protein
MSTSDFMAFAKFVDSAGVAWKRDGSGKLTEIKNNDGRPWTMD